MNQKTNYTFRCLGNIENYLESYVGVVENNENQEML